MTSSSTGAMTEGDFKVLVIGEPGTDKTSFMNCYVGRQFSATYKPTTGCGFGLKKIRRSRTEMVRLHVWDIAGQDHHRHLTRVFYRCASAAVVMFDLTSRDSFDHVKDWKKDLDSKVTLADGSPIPSLLLGNKSDLQHFVVDDEEIRSMMDDQGFVGWSKVSAKDYINVEESMLFLVDEMLARWTPTPVASINDGRRAVSHSTGIDTQRFSDSFELSHELSEEESTPCFCFY